MNDAVTRTHWIEEALKRYERPLLRHALNITGNIETARDVVQDTFLKLCKADRERVEGHLAAWLFTVCRNRALDVQKKEGRMAQPTSLDPIPTETAGPSDLAAHREAFELISEVLAAMSKPHQEAFRLKFQDQLTYREISQVMGKSLSSVSGLITTALCAVRDRLNPNAEVARENRQ
ncbi:MAG: sigma-70 family RNA polymerase sigma factor [Myxococcota bacterium]|nr:sigma-70 family RNA polymerase sigma factor [Myxococcota bacterium]